MYMSDIITSIFTLFGITSIPSTVQDFLWDLMILFVGMWLVKTTVVFFLSVFKMVMHL